MKGKVLVLIIFSEQDLVDSVCVSTILRMPNDKIELVGSGDRCRLAARMGEELRSRITEPEH